MNDPSGSAPRISIGLAVYNGERYLEDAIRSILAQSFADFELIISDNASSDATRDIATSYASQDGRIRYSRNEANIGGANNENLTFRRATGKYFRWAAHDDVLEPRFLEVCSAVLDSNPDVVLCHTQTVLIDENGNRIGLISRNLGGAESPSQRFVLLTPYSHDCEETYGLIRTDALRQTGLQRNYTDSDRTLLAHLSLLGKFFEVPEPLFHKRIHPGMSTKVYSDYRERMAWFGDEFRQSTNHPYLSQFAHYLSIIHSAPISPGEKLRCYRHMSSWLREDRRWRHMGKDVLLMANGLFTKLGRQS